MTKTLMTCAVPLIACSMLMTETSQAADRCVLIEQFTATWCGPCQSVGRATIDILDDYPDTVTGFQCHGSDDYTIAWGNSRMNFYGLTGFPTVWMDGWWSQVGSYGSDSANYNALMGGVNASLARPTDVSISAVGAENNNEQYAVSWDIGVDAGGQNRTVYFHSVQVLDVHPSGNHYYNCVIQAPQFQTLNLVAGQNVVVEQTYTLSGASLTDKDNVKYISWIQDVSGSSPAQVHNSIVHDHDGTPATTVTVAVDGSGDYSSIQDAIDEVGNLSIINVMPGTYDELLDFNGKNLSLIGVEGAENTIIDGGGNGTVLILLTDENNNTTIQGLTLTNGHTSLGAGIRCNSNPNIVDCVIGNNTSDMIVAGLLSAGVYGPLVTNTHFCNNEHSHIWGNWTDGGDNTFIEDCDFGGECEGDFTDDDYVNVNDILAVIAGWGDPYNVNDLLLVIANWNESCP